MTNVSVKTEKPALQYFKEDDNGNMVYVVEPPSPHPEVKPDPDRRVRVKQSHRLAPAIGSGFKEQKERPLRTIKTGPRPNRAGKVFTPPNSVLPAGWAVQSSPTLKDKEGNPINGLILVGNSLPVGTVIGEYLGEVITDIADAKTRTSNYMFEVNKRRKLLWVIDAQNPEKSSFLRFINAANRDEDINAMFYQYKRRIFAKTTKPVETGQEVLASYGKHTEAIINDTPV